MCQSNQLNELHGLLSFLLCAGQMHGQHNVFQCGEIGKEVPSVVLPYEAYGVALILHQVLFGHGKQILAAYQKGSGTGSVQTTNHI